MKKHFFFLLFALVASLGSLFASETQVDGIWYDFYSSKTAKVTYQGSSYSINSDRYKGEVVIPASVTYLNEEYSVTSIGYGAFSGCSGLTSVTIPNSVTSIGERAFAGCNGLTSVTWNARNCKDFESTDTPFCSRGFDLRKQISTFTIGNEVEHIPAYLCYGMTNLTQVTIPNSVTSIGDGAFRYCSSLTSIEIPNSVISIGHYAFSECSDLTSVTIPNSVTSIESSAFYLCNNLLKVSINSNEVVSKNYSSNFNFKDIFGSYVKEFIIGDSVTEIGKYAFYYYSSIKSVKIGNSVTSIGESAFYGCSNLQEVHITDIGAWFGITFYATSSNPLNYAHNLYLNDELVVDLVVPENVTQIKSSVFSGCRSLRSIIFPTTVTNIGKAAFSGCSGLTFIEIPSNVTNISEYAFTSCDSLITIVLSSPSLIEKDYDPPFYSDSSPTGMKAIFGSQVKEYIITDEATKIGAYTFYKCDSLKSITIGANVSEIGTTTFEGCKKMEKVDVRNIANWCKIGFAYYESNPLYYAGKLYSNGKLITDLIIPEGVTNINTYSFRNCNIESLTLPKSLKELSKGAFYGCSTLKQIICLGEKPAQLVGDYPFAYTNNCPIIIPCGSAEAYENAWPENYYYRMTYRPLEYKIIGNVNAEEMGSVAVPSSICDDSTTAVANYGYHFVQWSDGITDNPRKIELTQDTSLTAEFAKNEYSVSTLSNNLEQGTTYGDTLAHYLDTISIYAKPNYGYSFSYWVLDYYSVSNNPYKFILDRDRICKAIFEKSIYTLTLQTDKNAGHIEAEQTRVAYLDSTTINAVPNYGYHFVQWSDGVKDNPRKIELTQDTTFTAEFAFDRSGKCGNDSLLTWTYNPEQKLLTISGDGAFEENMAYGAEAPKEMCRLVIEDGVTSIGFAAFRNCSALESVSIPSSVSTIGAYAFSGAKLTQISLANTIQQVGSKAFANCPLEKIHWDIPTQSEMVNEGITVRLDASNLGWSKVNLYAWLDDYTQLLGSWPGTRLQAEANGFYSYTFPAEYNQINIIWNNGYSQTADIEDVTESTIYKLTGSTGTKIGWNSEELKASSPFYQCGETVTEFTLGNSVTSIPIGLCADFVKVERIDIPSSVTSIGAEAFKNCTSLKTLSLGENISSYGNEVFSGCSALDEIYNYRERPAKLGTDAFAGVDYFESTLYVLANSVDMYKSAGSDWKIFYFIEPIGASTVTTDNVSVIPSNNSVLMTWPKNDNAASYTIEITKDGEVFCRLVFNANGQLTGSAFAPSRDGSHHAPSALMTANGLQFTVTGLNSNTQYGYSVTAKDANDQTIATYSGEFTTIGEGTATGIEEISSSLQGGDRGRLILRDGQIFILRGDKTYTITGQVVK